MTHIQRILGLIQNHPNGLDDDEITEILGINQRQQVYQICTHLAETGHISRASIEKAGKRKKIHNFPVESSLRVADLVVKSRQEQKWQQRLNALTAATGKNKDELLDEALRNLALEVLKSQEST